MALPTPSLVCDFNYSKRLPSGFTFARSSIGTYRDVNKVLRYAAANEARFHTDDVANRTGLLVESPRTNLLTVSNEFDNVAWTKSASSSLQKGFLAPDGSYSATKLCEGTISGNHSMSASVTMGASVAYNQSFFLKAGENYAGRIRFGTNIGFIANIVFDLNAGTIVSATGVTNPKITPYANGWYRISGSVTSQAGTTTATAGIYIYQTDAASAIETYAGVDSSGLYVFGAQVELGAFETSYMPSQTSFTSRASSATYTDSETGVVMTTPTNLFTYSHDFTNAAWTKTGLLAFSSAGSLSNIAISPDGTQTASKLIESTANSAHSISQTITTVSGTAYTLSAYAKAGERTNVVLLVENTAGSGNFVYAKFDLSAGTAGSPTVAGTWPASITSVSISDAGYGWYRISLYFVAQGASTSLQLRLDNGVGTGYAGDGASGAYVYGCQLNIGPLQVYTATTATAVTTGGSRSIYNPYSMKNEGVLVEPAATNSYASSQSVSAWTKADFTVTAGAKAPDNSFTAGSFLESVNNIARRVQAAVITGDCTQNWCFSVYVKANSKRYVMLRITDTTASTFIESRIQLHDGAIVSTAASGSCVFKGTGARQLSNGWWRVWISGVPGTTLSGTVRCDVYGLSDANSTAYAGSTAVGYYIWGSQLESGIYPTSYIPTFGSTASRSADVYSSVSLSRSGDAIYRNTGDWFNGREGTVYSVSKCYGLEGTTARIWHLENTDSASEPSQNYISAHYNSTVQVGQSVKTFNTITANLLSTISAGAVVSNAFAWKANDVAGSVGGAASQTDNATTIPVLKRLCLGSYSGASDLYLNGLIFSFYYFPSRVANADLEKLSNL